MGAYTVVARGSGFELGVWCCADPEPSAHEPERATGYTIIFPVAGAFVRELEGQREFADSTRVVFENAGEWYRVTHPVPGGDRCTVLALAESMAETLAPLLDAHGDRLFRRQSTPAAAALYTLHRRLLATALDTPADPLALDELAHVAMQLAVRSHGSESVRPRLDGRHPVIAVQRALELIHACYHRPLTLAEIAHHAGYSPFHFTRVFRRRTGLPVHRYVTRLRLRASYDAVLAGASDLTRVALDFGFCSHSYFTAVFTREFGINPSALRPGHRRAQLARAPGSNPSSARIR